MLARRCRMRPVSSVCMYFSLSSSFPFVRGEVLPTTFSPPYLIAFSSPALLTSLLTQSSHLSLGLPRLLLPCSRNSAALFGSMSSAILSTCPAHCNLLLTSISVKLLCTPVTSLNSTIIRLSAIVTLAIFVPSCFRTLAVFVVVGRSVPRCPFCTGMPV